MPVFLSGPGLSSEPLNVSQFDDDNMTSAVDDDVINATDDFCVGSEEVHKGLIISTNF
jgi:hypothetical protein